MAVVVATGRRVVPGDVVFAGGPGGDALGRVTGGDGCRVRLVAAGLAEEQRVVATRVGVVQWSGDTVSVLRTNTRARGAAPIAMTLRPHDEAAAPSALARSTTVFGPRLEDTVHMRVVRVSRIFAFGEIIAVNGVWCSNGHVGAGMAGAFRGVVRVEDIRPFKPTKEQMSPSPPAAAFQAGDVIIATVLSQSDVRQYQLSTIPEHCGVVEAFVTTDRVRVKLQHIYGRRDAMRNPTDGSVHRRWCPLISPEAF